MSHWLPSTLQLAGSVAEIIGIVLMANGLLSGIAWGGVLRTLIDAIRRGPSARGAVRMSELGEENGLHTLQGLAFVLVGFVLQAVGTVLSMLVHG
ncbi:MAG: hypothetical protein ACC742_12510 [Thermoanaerobaculales bacterium]